MTASQTTLRSSNNHKFTIAKSLRDVRQKDKKCY